MSKEDVQTIQLNMNGMEVRIEPVTIFDIAIDGRSGKRNYRVEMSGHSDVDGSTSPVSIREFDSLDGQRRFEVDSDGVQAFVTIHSNHQERKIEESTKVAKDLVPEDVLEGFNKPDLSETFPDIVGYKKVSIVFRENGHGDSDHCELFLRTRILYRNRRIFSETFERYAGTSRSDAVSQIHDFHAKYYLREVDRVQHKA